MITLTVFGCKQKQKDIDKTLITKKVDSVLNGLYKQGKFNGNVLVIKNGENLYNKSFGYADSSKSELLSSDFRFGIGSIYKEFPAVAIMQLSEEGKLNINDTIQMYLPNLPKWVKVVTIKNLLQYSSGLPRIDFGKYFLANELISDSDIFNDLMNIQELEFQPGSDYIYSNNSPFLLIKIVEKVSGQNFNSYAKEKLFAPNNLKNTIFKEQYPYKNNSAMALPFNSDFEQDEYKVNTETMLLSSNVEDLYNWIEELHTFNIINKESLNFLTKTAKIDRKDMQAPLGNCVLNNGHITEHTHHGSMGNYECLIQRYNLKNLSIIILTNQKNSNVFDISKSIKTIVTNAD